jgi:hypothetical protein
MTTERLLAAVSQMRSIGEELMADFSGKTVLVTSGGSGL